jgi:ribonuclease BN (tRNA processing enzyme)
MKRIENEFSLSPEESMRLFRKNNDIALLARKTGTSHTVLLDRLNPDRDAKLGYLDAIGHSHLTNDHVLLKSWANEMGYGLFKKPVGNIGDEDILDIFLGIQRIQGCFAETLHEAREDGIIDSNENRQLGSIIDEIINELATLKAEIKNQVREVA